jgi:hypothetical protein
MWVWDSAELSIAPARRVIASEAKQSIERQGSKRGLLRRSAPRNDGILSHVVPAHAGTHTPRPIVEGCCWTTFAQHKALWLWVPAFAGTTMWGYTAAFPRRYASELCKRILDARQRAWGMPGAWRTRSRAWCVVNTRVSHHGYTGSPGIPARNGFTVSFALSPVTGLCCHRHRRFLANLTPASGRQDHTTSPSAGSRPRQKRYPRPPHPIPRP